MSDQADSDRPTEATFLDNGPVISDENIAAFLGGAAVGACICGVAAYFFGGGERSEEPPIRVKGGSIKFEIVDDEADWVEDSGKTKWILDGPPKLYDGYKVVVAVIDDDGNTQITFAFGKWVRVHYESQGFVQLSPKQRHTRLVSHHPMKKDTKRLVTHPRSIESIQVGGAQGGEGGIVYQAQYGAPKLDYIELHDHPARRRR